MLVSRRTQMIWQSLLFIPLMGLTTDVLASEAARRAHVAVDVPWLFSDSSILSASFGQFGDD